MPNDIALSVTVTRTELGLGDLEINDGTTYICTPKLDPGAVSYRREQVKSPFVDGTFTISRVKDQTEFQLVVDVLGSTHSAMQSAVGTLIDAMTQDEFTLKVVIDGATYSWTCEAGDYAMGWSNAHFASTRTAVAFTLPRKPVPASGPI